MKQSPTWFDVYLVNVKSSGRWFQTIVVFSECPNFNWPLEGQFCRTFVLLYANWKDKKLNGVGLNVNPLVSQRLHIISIHYSVKECANKQGESYLFVEIFQYISVLYVLLFFGDSTKMIQKLIAEISFAF